MKNAAHLPQNTPHIPQEEYANVCAKLAESQAQSAQLQQQVDWFKRQLFGRKSEKHMVDNPDQAQLFGQAQDNDLPPAPKETVKGYARSNKQRSDDNVNDTGLRFTDDVPTKVIDIPCPELEGEDADKYEIIGTKETHRLAQLPGSYQVLIYRKDVVRQKDSGAIRSPSTPVNVLEGTYADVSLLAGLMVDKAVYHLPLHRQHLRMLQSGVTLSRAPLCHRICRL